MISRRWKQIKTGLICSVFAFLFVSFLMNEMESRRIRHMPSITANALNYSYHPVRLPLKPASTVLGEHVRSISLNETDANALVRLYYSKEKKLFCLKLFLFPGFFHFVRKSFVIMRFPIRKSKKSFLNILRLTRMNCSILSSAEKSEI